VENKRHWKDAFGQWQSRVLVQNEYTYDAAGNRLTNQISDQNGPVRTEEYGYDALNRLTDVDYDDGEVQGYAFDAMGNRLSKTVNGTSESYTYNAANMLLTRGTGSYTNDANGNTLTGGGRTNTWDGQNRLTECVNGNTTTEFTYGSDGLRRQSVTGNDTTDYVLDGNSVVRTFLNSSVDKTFLHGVRGPEYERTGSGNPVWYLYDGLGSVLGTVDGSGNLVSTRKYDVYGAVRASTGGSGPKHKFVGSLGHPSEDETGLIYMRARYYDPVTGRFASEDPAGDGNNFYCYSSCNPVNMKDPDGKKTIYDGSSGDLSASDFCLMWGSLGLYACLLDASWNKWTDPFMNLMMWASITAIVYGTFGLGLGAGGTTACTIAGAIAGVYASTKLTEESISRLGTWGANGAAAAAGFGVYAASCEAWIFFIGSI